MGVAERRQSRRSGTYFALLFCSGCSCLLLFLTQIYHATCHAEARTSATTIAARLRMDAAVVRSRSATPDVSSQRGTPPRTTSVKTESSPLRLAGTKRKVESEDVPGLGSEAEGSPPMKKTLLSTA